MMMAQDVNIKEWIFFGDLMIVKMLLQILRVAKQPKSLPVIELLVGDGQLFHNLVPLLARGAPDQGHQLPRRLGTDARIRPDLVARRPHLGSQ